MLMRGKIMGRGKQIKNPDPNNGYPKTGGTKHCTRRTQWLHENVKAVWPCMMIPPKGRIGAILALKPHWTVYNPSTVQNARVACCNSLSKSCDKLEPEPS